MYACMTPLITLFFENLYVLWNPGAEIWSRRLYVVALPGCCPILLWEWLPHGGNSTRSLERCWSLTSSVYGWWGHCPPSDHETHMKSRLAFLLSSWSPRTGESSSHSLGIVMVLMHQSRFGSFPHSYKSLWAMDNPWKCVRTHFFLWGGWQIFQWRRLLCRNDGNPFLTFQHPNP